MIPRLQLPVFRVFGLALLTWAAAAGAQTPATPNGTPAPGDAPPHRPLTLPRRPASPATTPSPLSTAPQQESGTDSGQERAPKPRPLSLSPRPSSATGTSGTGASSSASPIRITPKSPASTTAPKKAPATEHATAAGVPTGPLNRTAVVLDPARGGVDGGSRIGDALLEKDVTLALAFKLRSLLNARGFAVTLTREDDAAMQPKSPDTPLSLNDRAGIANHARGIACLLLHATGSGNGVHLYSSELEQAPGEAAILPWLTAQAAWVNESHHLQRLLGEAMSRAEVPLVASVASVRPLDSLTCPAVVVELAPRTDDPASINDAAYQQRVAEAIVGTLVYWQNTAQAPPRLPAPIRATTSIRAVGSPAASAATAPEVQP